MDYLKIYLVIYSVFILCSHPVNAEEKATNKLPVQFEKMYYCYLYDDEEKTSYSYEKIFHTNNSVTGYTKVTMDYGNNGSSMLSFWIYSSGSFQIKDNKHISTKVENASVSNIHPIIHKNLENVPSENKLKRMINNEIMSQIKENPKSSGIIYPDNQGFHIIYDEDSTVQYCTLDKENFENLITKSKIKNALQKTLPKISDEIRGITGD